MVLALDLMDTSQAFSCSGSRDFPLAIRNGWPLFVFLSLGTVLPALAGEPPAKRPLGAELPVFEAPADASQRLGEPPQPSGLISLRDALAAALQGNPELASLSWETRSREARALQQGLRPNPSVSVELEDFGGSGERQAFDSNQTTISLAQLVELGGKRAKRARLAELETTLSSWDYETKRVAVLADTTKAFLLVLALQERGELFRELEALSAETVRSVASTVKSGAVAPTEEDRARVNLERVQLAATRAGKELDAARSLLSATWGGTSPTFTLVVGNLFHAPVLPPIDALHALAPESPEVARWNTEVSAREASLALERARRVPDVTASLGARHYADTDDVGLVAQLSIPIPFFDRNQGSILDARYRIAKAASERRATEVTVRAQLEAAYRSLEAALLEVSALRDEIIPRATRVFDATRRGYATGLYRYVEVLDAQRTLFEAKQELLEALTSYHLTVTDLERLTASPLERLHETPRP